MGTTSLGTTAQAPNVCPNFQTSLDDGVQGCISSPLPACRSINLCETFLPNRFNLGDSLTKLQERYNEYTNKLNITCHPYAIRFLCFRFSPPCPKVTIEETSEPYYAFDIINFPHVDIPLPCKSLCENISETCIEDEPERKDLSSRCSTLPESTSEEICFGSALAQVSLCNSFTCENGGSCFTVNDRQYCKCQPGYFGTHCEVNTSSDYRVIQGHCVSVPEQCRSVLPYNATRGLNLSDSHLAYIAGWERIAPMAYEGIMDTRVILLFCGLFYPPCAANESGSTSIVCWDLCILTKLQYEFILASLGFPTLLCEKLHKEAPPGYTCLS
ncbi:hypothetical protein HOLleu_40722 [Holothuria leucospilota]|uniref:Uncharacterized protein n=1 Tax=Holothuria leucospilota TaxID=206669 RepID=A0A9Q0YDV5_HOLLE|nr:hypothetical protein HOLleu_40722 [Holothuria leucospilota]